MRSRAGWVGVAFALCALAGRGGEWPQWRGPRGDGTSLEQGIPLHWSASENVRWKVAVPGNGHSSPVVWGDRVFLTTCLEREGQRVLLCLDRRDGKLLWQRVVVTAPLEQKHYLNSCASSTPATDGRLVWVSFEAPHKPNEDVERLSDPRDFPNLIVACYGVDGRPVWKRSPGKFRSKHGFCSPPIPYRDTIIINGDQDAGAYLVALDKSTGAERWRTDRPNRTRSYCPPLVIDVGGKKELVLSGSKCVAAYDADTGKQQWIVDGPTEQFVASPVYARGVVFITGGFPEYHLIGIRPDGHGNVTHTKVIWHSRRGASYVPSPVTDGTYFYVVSDDGKCSCLDARTGKRYWFERLGPHHSASPMSAGGYLYWPDDNGRTFVIKAGPRFQLVSKNDLGEEMRASPAISHGEIFLRTFHHLYCIGREEKVQSRR